MCSRKVRPRSSSQLGVKPVHPTNVGHHGLFGETFLRQHMMIDERWTVGSLTEQFKGMTDLLAKRSVFKKLEAKSNSKEYVREGRNLKRQIRDGRTKLQMILHGENTKHVRNFLINHKDMQRLYQKMPVQLVVENINQRTFVMRKERDRLRFRLNQLKEEYERKLLEKALIENRIKYENEFVLDEEVKSCSFRKKIENSNVRLKAIKTINGTYKKIIQVLRHDGIFYEPILRSLSKDIEDQSNFIKHILHLGMPAIAKFRELSEEYRIMEEKARKNHLMKMNLLNSYKKQDKSANVGKQVRIDVKTDIAQRYVRETNTMLFLKHELEAIENTIKQIKFSTLCSQAKEIFPRIKSQMENNKKLHKMIENNMIGYDFLKIKRSRAEVLEGVLINNLTEEETQRLLRIEELKQQIVREDEIEAETLAHIKNRADVYVLLRFTLWNLNEILRHVDRPSRSVRVQYPNSYLKLPLLKFEMLTMHAFPPEIYETNIDNIMQIVKRKVHKLVRTLTKELPKEEKERVNEEYHQNFMANLDADAVNGAGDGDMDEDDDLLGEGKTAQNVPNRRQLKAQSAKLVEELSKKED